MPRECFHLRPTTNKCAPVSGFYNWPEVVQLRKHDAAGWALLHFESFLSLSFLFCLSPFDAPLLLLPFFFVLFAPAYSITTDATDSSLSTSLLRRDISRGWMNNQDIKVESRTSRQKDAYSKHPFVPNVWESVASFHDIKNIHHDDIHLAQQFHQGLRLNVITIFIVYCSTRKISKRETKYLKILWIVAFIYLRTLRFFIIAFDSGILGFLDS